MFDFWEQFKTAADDLEVGIDFRVLSPQNKSNVIPYMSDRIDGNLLVEIINSIKKYPVFNDTYTYIGTDYVINKDCAFFINPLNQFNIQTAYERAQLNTGQSFDKVGIVVGSHPVFKKKRQVESILDEHSSLKFFKKLIKIATNQNASDIHIAPRNKTHIYFRFRVDGILIDNLIDDLDTKFYALLANQFLLQANEESGNLNRIVDAKFNIEDKNTDIAVRLAMMPTEYLFKNKVNVPRFVLRIHNDLQNIKSLNSIGLNTYSYQKANDLLKLTQGLIVVTGPTGSGKTTFLYALLKAINDSENGKSIQTLEDPVEKNLGGIDQCSINSDANITYERGLKAFLRQDPDVALIGEIRDTITAEKVTEIAMTGHLALSTLHTNTSLGTINRLRRLGIDDRDTAETLTHVVATRLVRKVCQHCAQQINLDDELSEHYKDLFVTHNAKEVNIVIAGDGCAKCKYKAYDGRLLVAEILSLDAQAKLMITNQKSIIEIEQYLVSKAQQTLWHHAIELLFKGVTTLTELQRVLPPYDDSIFFKKIKGEIK